MAFNSIIFIFIFAPVVLVTNFFLPTKVANLFILASSVLFYGWGEPRFLFVVFISAVFDYGLGLAIARQDQNATARFALAAGVCANIGLLVYCKYLAFFLGTLGTLIGGLGFPLPEILLPLGLSFIVFEKITYLVDIYRKVTPPARHFTDYLFFVFFFPKMLAGPIIKYHEISAQIERRSLSSDDAVIGASRFIMGLAKKVLVADSMAQTVEGVFSAPAGQIGFADAWVAALCFAMQIYFDFSGYSDMAIGLARILGFRLRENFNQPYLAIGFTDFWHR
jgi:alginate O-acetyltransferase complex protein AlgI